MPVKYFISKDSQGRQWPPDNSGEKKEVLEIIKRVYSAYNDEDDLYAIIANLHVPHAYADLVVMTPRGMGVVELKGSYGKIYRKGSSWFAGSCPTPIQAGSENTPARNPHEQVRAYTETIRQKLLTPLLGTPWLPGNSKEWEEYFKFSTAVCFTNRQANIEELRNTYHPPKLTWESYSDVILTPPDIPKWIYSLTFEANKGSRDNYEPYILDTEQILRIIMHLLGATEWTEIDKFMPEGKPYGILIPIENKLAREPIYLYDNKESLIGRDATKCHICVPQEGHGRVSNKHAMIVHTLKGVFVEDLGSKHGTYLNGRLIRKKKQYPFKYGDRLSLGGVPETTETYLLEFSEPEIIRKDTL